MSMPLSVLSLPEDKEIRTDWCGVGSSLSRLICPLRVGLAKHGVWIRLQVMSGIDYRPATVIRTNTMFC
jgi:hypothetical protein